MRRFFSLYTTLCWLFFMNASHAQTPFSTAPPLKVNLPFLHFPPLTSPANQLISAHKPNYFLPVHYISQHKAKTYPDYFVSQKNAHESTNNQLKDIEVAFQIGAKALLATVGNASFYATYTQQSYWQFYADSAFFRATDYKPQFFTHIPLALHGPFNDASIRIGYAHQSNGRGSAKERSWNRIYSSFKFNLNHAAFLIKIWRIQNDAQLDYNSDISQYLGYGKIGFMYYFHPDHVITIQKRLSTREVWHTGEFEYLFPIIPLAQGIIKGFSGYGESLMTYNLYTVSLSMGIVLRFV